jgi:hypothetical protein
MCKWEKPSSGGKKGYKNYGYWKLVEETGSSNVWIIYRGSTKETAADSGDEFHYTSDEIWRGGYSNLRMSRTASSVTCEE